MPTLLVTGPISPCFVRTLRTNTALSARVSHVDASKHVRHRPNCDTIHGTPCVSDRHANNIHRYHDRRSRSHHRPLIYTGLSTSSTPHGFWETSAKDLLHRQRRHLHHPHERYHHRVRQFHWSRRTPLNSNMASTERKPTPQPQQRGYKRTMGQTHPTDERDYIPIADHGLIGNLRTAALVSLDGSSTSSLSLSGLGYECLTAKHSRVLLRTPLRLSICICAYS
jgi:hypothetical protein